MHSYASIRILTVFLTYALYTRAEANDKLANFYLSGLRECQDGIRSASVVGTGVRRTMEVSVVDSRLQIGRIRRETPITIEWFLDRSSVRFSRREDQIDGSVIVTEDAVTSYQKSEHVVKSHKQTAYSQRIGFFDVRMIGQMSLAELESGKSMDWLRQQVGNRDPVEVSVVDDLCKISWVYPQQKLAGEVRRTLWIDGANGFTPVRLELRARPPESNIDWSNLPLMSWVEVVWSQSNDVWIPTATKMTAAYGEEEVELNLEWQNINGKVPAAEFTVNKIRAPDGTYVVDERLGTPIIESILGEPKTSSKLSSYAWAKTLILINVVLIVVLIIWIRHKRTNTIHQHG